MITLLKASLFSLHQGFTRLGKLSFDLDSVQKLGSLFLHPDNLACSHSLNLSLQGISVCGAVCKG